MQKQAESQASWALLTQGVTSARLEAHRMRQLIQRALQVIENSPHREEIYQQAGDVIMNLPDRLDRLDNLLDRTAYALSVAGKEFLHSRISLVDRKLVDDCMESIPIVPPRPPSTVKKSMYIKDVGDLSGYRTFVDEDSAKGLPADHQDQAIGPQPGPRTEYFTRPEMNKGKPEETRIIPVPGEEYGHPWKEEVTQRRTEVVAARHLLVARVATRHLDRT